jgi:hypothetical protein
LLLELDELLELELLEEFELEFDEEFELELDEEFELELEDELPAIRVAPSSSLDIFILGNSGASSGIAAAAVPAPSIAMPASADMVTVDLVMVSLLLFPPHIAALRRTASVGCYSDKQPALQKTRIRKTAASFPAAARLRGTQLTRR